MRLRTYVAIYLLILAILFSSVGIVSFHLNNSQLSILKEQSAGQFQTIMSSLGRDIAVLWGREPAEERFGIAVDDLVRGYARYYSRHGIALSIADLRQSGQSDGAPPSEITVRQHENGHFIVITGALAEPFGHFLLDYRMNITGYLADMRDVQQ